MKYPPENIFHAATRDEAALRAALEEADIVPAALVLVHLTGDLAILDEMTPHIQGGWNYMEKVPEPLRRRIRERLVAVLKEKAADPRLPALPPPDVLHRIMSASVGAQMPPEYVPLFIEELGLAQANTRALQWRRDPAPLGLADFRVLIAGAGLSGICAAVRLKQAGIPFVILERNETVGGTWHENTYPDCGVDTPSHFYSYSFNPNPEWSRYFAKRDEIQQYIEDTTDKFGLREHIRFGVSVQSARLDEESGLWLVHSVDRDGRAQAQACNVFITAVGHNVPATPSIEGLQDFRGDVVHTAKWDPAVKLDGRRVAMIGTGASGMQAGPALAPKVDKLTIFQRSPHWAMGNPNYHRAVADGQKWALRHIPYFNQWARFLIFWAASDSFHDSLFIDPDWDQPDISLNAKNHQMRENILAYMREQLGGDEALMRKCTPGYPPYGKRLLRDNHWFATLKRPNVELETDAIACVTADGILTRTGKLHEVDAIVMATGFHASKLLWPMEIIGRGGRSIRELWGDDDPRAYKGMSVPGFPNLFVLAGPNTILSHGGSAIFHSECQVTYILQAVREMVERNLRTLEVRREVHDRYNQQIDERHRNMVWAHPGVTSWYKNKHNRVTMTSPWRLVDFWSLTREFNPDDYLCTTAAPYAAAA
ncbi:flavin-containing monooxygenase [Bordetella pseudohinzii]|uniref:4-hydroxyacetophenone monooxygenase n=1 Tax=Bordetella pseudohinzii TaxID=1331258 RepID=A0A0J6C181_9BORD|nr:NAD(P)/FAD-dependent oxidoreductase [Bordetella pseudohinzii]ANY17710.1 hypothetical protein BBN53_18555 [Bordetella pseudohinzii]KMM24788.1 hypothetical protein L540_04500 [Bordetella pseudohinzii]KXA77951.1 hypothetical protein AW877_13230 [Bordetella pseudohinzii]KXA79690.1 hypothetical protein AW878_09535 [Bordetella pseudohinzii]CUJ01944.1 4-hydroxyacetophenone monooxygenase [Bordetella pseudohinzii]